MSIFGWSYPAGCSSVPGDEPTPLCILCGKDPEQDADKGGCSCPECPECGTVGCLEHLSLSNLITRTEILGHQYHGMNQEYHRRQKAAAVKCSGCGKKILPDLIDGGPLWCPDCKKNLDSKGQFLPVIPGTEFRHDW
jgi:DNA-directed RNA polymerase subunit RPC12/RpoP